MASSSQNRNTDFRRVTAGRTLVDVSLDGRVVEIVYGYGINVTLHELDTHTGNTPRTNKFFICHPEDKGSPLTASGSTATITAPSPSFRDEILVMGTPPSAQPTNEEVFQAHHTGLACVSHPEGCPEGCSAYGSPTNL